MIKQRQQRIRLGLADALDPTVICVETGLALDQALMRVSQDLQQAHDPAKELLEIVMRRYERATDAREKLEKETATQAT
jgi:tight adherence protein C